MARFDINCDEDSDILAEETVKGKNTPKKTRFPKEEQVNKRMSKKLSRNIEKSAAEDNNAVSVLLNRITAGATLRFQDDSVIENEKHVIHVAGNDLPENAPENITDNGETVQKRKGHAIVRVEYGPQIKDTNPELSPEEFCKNINLRFTTDDKMVLKIFQDPLNIPKGTKFLIVDQYFEFGCICAVEQIVRKNKSGTMLILKRLDTGGITTYTDASIKDAKEIRHIN